MGEDAPLRSLLSTRGGGWKRIDPRSQISVAPPSPQSSNLRVGRQLPFHIVTAGPEDDASGAGGLELARRSRNSSRVPVKVICLAADTSTSASWPFEMSRE